MAQLAEIRAVASSFGIELSPVDVHQVGEIERAITEFRGSNNGLIIVSTALASLHRGSIIKLAAKSRLPAVYVSVALSRRGVVQ